MASMLSAAESATEAMQKVAEAAGIANWSEVESIAYTFHVKLPNRSVERSWQWWPDANKVEYTEGDAIPVTYLRDGEPDPIIDQKFINDLYWLAFPFVVVWDDSVTLEMIEPSNFTADIEAAGGIKVIYPDGVGYTPGDVYEVYYDTDYQMTHWVFRKGGNETPNLVSTWEDHTLYGPLVLSMEHRAYPEGDFHLWFTDVEVTTAEP